MLRRLARWLQPAALILSVLAIAWFLYRQWPSLRTYPWRLDWRWLAVTLIVTFTSWAIEVTMWHRLIEMLGGRLPFWAAVRIWFLSAVMRYVPGNIWQSISMT